MTAFIAKAEYIRSMMPTVNIVAYSEPEPWEDFKIMQDGYEKEYRLKPGDTVIDCGAYIGIFSIYASKAVGPKGTVYSFEPVPENYGDMLRNIKLNKCENIHKFCYGLGDRKEYLLMDVNESESSFCQFRNKRDADLRRFPVTTIDRLVKTNNIEKVDFLKLDVEGFEVSVLRGAQETLINNDVKVAVASYHRLDYRPTYPDVEAYLRKLGYTVNTSNPLHLTTYAYKR